MSIATDSQHRSVPDRCSTPAHGLPICDVVAKWSTDPVHGLSPSRVAELRSQFGFNELAQAAPVPLWKKFLGQFRDLVIWILIVAAVIAGGLGEWIDTIAILAIVLLNAVLGFVQEAKAEQALAALQKMSAPSAKVIRDGELQSVAARSRTW